MKNRKYNLKSNKNVSLEIMDWNLIDMNMKIRKQEIRKQENKKCDNVLNI